MMAESLMAESLQAGLALGFAACVVIAFIVGARIPAARPLAFAVGVVAGSHALYYVLFLWFPDVLDAPQTMLLSIALRYEVLWLVTISLALAIKRARWEK